MATVVLKFFAGQGSVMDGRTKQRLYASPFREHNNYVRSCLLNVWKVHNVLSFTLQDVFLMISVIYHELYAEDKQLKYSLITHIYCEFSLNSIYFQISIYTWQHTSIQIHGKWIRKQVT